VHILLALRHQVEVAESRLFKHDYFFSVLVNAAIDDVIDTILS
jgi:hypothetical protein